MQRTWSRTLLLILAAFALVVAACGSDDDDGDAGGSGENGNGEETADFKACEITDTGGIDDKSFNQTAYKGITDTESLGVEGQAFESESEQDFEPNITQAMRQGCDLIVTVGFLLGDATLAAAEANPDQKFAIVDYAYFDDDGEKIDLPNVRELTFNTDEAAFLAGYLAAGVTETGKVATYGGLEIPTVTIFMDGFLAGVNQYNADNGTEVELLGWDGTTGQFVGNFEDSDKGKTITETFLQDGADIVMPVAGPVGQGTLAAVEEAGGSAAVIWVDTDGCVSVADSCQHFLTSVMKNMDVAVADTIAAALDGNFESGLYIGTLANEGVGIAPFNEWEDRVPQELADKVEEYRAQIAESGELPS